MSTEINTTEGRKLYAEGTTALSKIRHYHNVRGDLNYEIESIAAMHRYYPALLDAWDDLRKLKLSKDILLDYAGSLGRIRQLEYGASELRAQLAKARELVGKLSLRISCKKQETSVTRDFYDEEMLLQLIRMADAFAKGGSL